ncbi:MAG TPA: hypothetical protein VMR54_04090 [Thermoanaerobaculia bacterium]|nr:hypothetical protein [Thermoanaerobaculia bacterium]
MSERRSALACLILLLFSFPLAAQTGLRDLVTDFLREGITLAPPPPGVVISHVAHFVDPNSTQFIAIREFNDELATQLATFPLASSAGGFAYRYDPALGTFTRTTESFGPIYTERADTIGKGKFNGGINYSHFTFDRIDNLSLTQGDLHLVFTHIDVPSYVKGDVITADLRMNVTADVTAFVLTYGLANNLDLGLAIPLERIDITAQTSAEIQRLATQQNTSIHRFQDGSSAETFQTSGSASGIGDILLRAKWRLLDARGGGGLAVAADVRMPTGEERDLLGTGTWLGGGFLIGSLQLGTFSPHINAGYTWSSNPPSSSDQPGGTVSTIPNYVSYAGGFDWAISPRVTFIVDVLGRTYRNAQAVTVVNQTYTADTGDNLGGDCKCQPEGENPPRTITQTFPQLTSTTASVNTWQGSIGIKVNPVWNLLVTANVLFSLNRKGLQDSISPLFALDYAF